MSEIASIAEEIKQHRDCGVPCQTRTNAVPGEGSETAEIVFIGEAPGFYEDRQGRPFVGPAGHLLDRLLLGIGLKRDDVFITNVLKCRPPNNRDPLPAEVQVCSRFLDRQIAAIKPKVIVTLGRHSMARFFPRDTISKVHGKARPVGDVLVLPLYHPAAALRNEAVMAALEQDFQQLPELVRRAQASSGSTQEADKPEENPGQQLSMF